MKINAQCPKTFHWIGRFVPVFVFLCLFLFVLSAEARKVRVATYNVEHGVGKPGSEKYKALKAILARADADVVAFQELKRETFNEWGRLAEELGYTAKAWGDIGPFSGTMVVGFFSRFPITDIHSVPSPEGTREFSRIPQRIVVQVPGAARPLVLWNMHHKAMFMWRDNFRRAIEAMRIVQDIERYLEANRDHVEFIVLGDMNDDVAREDQSYHFRSQPSRLPSSFVLGSDIEFPVRYQVFPTDRYAKAGGGMRHVPAFRQGSTNTITHLHTNYTLDYVFVSDAIWNNPAGRPVGEIYHSEWDGPEGGLKKAGDPLPAHTSLQASDHYPVFVDLHMEDADVQRN